MKVLSSNEAIGDQVNMKITSKKHIAEPNDRVKTDSLEKSFRDLFNKTLAEVNDKENYASDLVQKMTVDPESVNIHDVQIAGEQAEVAVLFTKGIVDRVIRAYKEIISVR